jgi:DNA-binding NarL/FixJ family response regulator
MAVELRDQFALAAMRSLSMKLGDPDAIARTAYRIADAMLRARVADLPDLPMFREPPVRKPVFRRSTKPKATRSQIPQIIQLKKEGLSNKQIADRLGLNGQSVNGIVAISRGKPGGRIRKSQN